MAKILIIGCGAIGLQLATVLSANGHEVTGVKRNPRTFSDDRIRMVAADIASAKDLDQLATDYDRLVFIVSADDRTEASYRNVYQVGLDNLLEKFPRQSWLFVSSTSVYGQSQGEWVDENSPAEPHAIASQLIRQAEQKVIALNPNNSVVRFSGIYGPGREYLLRMAQQTPSIQQMPVYYTNRIHQQDCVGVLAFLLEQSLAGIVLEQCYLASDDDPAPMWDVITWLAEQLHCPPPIAKIADHGASMNKRCNNQRLKALGYRFIYPGYKDGYIELIKQ
ncbi:MAG: SDR family oxidoreductase [Methylococcaceae bacterium]